MAKKRMPIYGIIGFFRQYFVHKSAKCQYFLMKPSLLEMWYQITFFLQFLGQNILKCGFHAQKTPKNGQKWPYLISRIFTFTYH